VQERSWLQTVCASLAQRPLSHNPEEHWESSVQESDASEELKAKMVLDETPLLPELFDLLEDEDLHSGHLVH